MAVKMLPQKVADAFVKQYYMILNKCPEEVHKFYGESSLVGWPEHDGVLAPVTTLSGINDKILSSDYKNCLVEVKTVDAQASHDGGVIVAVTGSFIDKDEVTNSFFQTFFLARQERGFFVLNDILRVITNVAANAPTLPSSAVPNVSDSPIPSPTKADDEIGKIKEALDISVPKNSVAKCSSPSSSIASGEKVLPVVEPVSNANMPPVIAPAPNADEPSVVTPSNANVPLKTTYASMVAKATQVTSTTPKTTPKASAPLVNGAAKASAPLVNGAAKALAPLVNGAAKASNLGSFMSKALASPGKVVTKLPTGGNSTPDTNPHANDRGVYIGRLPYDITKQGVVEVLRKFGPVRRYSDAVQIRKYEDGFCCGFVEFESADSARRAVEAHHVKFGEKEAYIAYKKSSYNRVGSRSPTRGGFRNSSENQSDYETGRAMGSQRSPSSGQGERQASPDRLN